MMRVILPMVALMWSLPVYAAVGDVDQPGVCYMCHDTVEAEQELPHVHSAFASGNCSDCHNPHASRHDGLLMEDQGELCRSCHDGIAERVADENPHVPAARGECTTCHAPHASVHEMNLRLDMVGQCASCHPAVPGWLDRALVHAPVSEGECVICHDPHGGEFDSLLAGDVRDACVGCHTPDAAMTAAHGSPAIADSDCTVCHDPHSSSKPGLLRMNEHGPFEAGNCETCHGQMEGRTTFRVTEIRSLCERCHTSTKRFAGFPYHHNLDEFESCVQCHNPHASNVEALLLRNQADMCSGCHFSEPSREKQKSGYITHDSMDCTQCHVPHGGEDPMYLRTLTVALCADCHTDAHRVSHPVGPEILDPRTGQPVTCLSCHQLHGADFAKYLPADPTRELCLQCHRR
jgi:predicted CXXCH cytochrome family protein